MGWASEAFLRDMGVAPTRVATLVVDSQEPIDTEKGYESIGMVHVCDDRHIIRETEKAIMVRIGQTLYGKPITTFYPKSLCRIRYKDDGSYSIYVPKWTNRSRTCVVGEVMNADAHGLHPMP